MQNNLKQIRNNKNLLQTKVAMDLNITQETISSYETYDCLSKRKPKIQIKKINVDIQKDRHAFSKEYSNVNYKYKSSMTSRK